MKQNNLAGAWASALPTIPKRRLENVVFRWFNTCEQIESTKWFANVGTRIRRPTFLLALSFGTVSLFEEYWQVLDAGDFTECPNFRIPHRVHSTTLVQDREPSTVRFYQQSA